MRPPVARVLWDMVDGPMPRGLLGVGMGDLHPDGETWRLHLGGFSMSFRNRLYTATAQGDDVMDAAWTVETDRRGRAVAIVADAPRDAWDGGGMHTPSFLPAADGRPARIFYAGRAGRKHTGAGSRYAIGMLEHIDGRWRRIPGPIVAGDAERPSAFEPRVVHDGERFVLWYLAAPHEVGPGEQPDFELRVTTSVDGVTGWSPPALFATSAEGFFDIAVSRRHDRWVMVLARGTNLHGTAPFPAQGLWIMQADVPSPDRAAWSAPERLFDTDAEGTPEWMARGVCDPAIVPGDGPLTVFVSGTRRYRSWVDLAWRRLRARRRPPVPAPYFLSTAVLRFEE